MRWSIFALGFTLLFPMTVYAQTVQEKWQKFYQQNWQSSPLAISQQQLSQYSPDLLVDESRYPNFESFSWQDIELLASIKTDCSTKEYANKRLADAVEFELALCEGRTLHSDWFSTHTVLHPAGQSFADRYLQHIGNNKATNKNKATNQHKPIVDKTIRNYLSIVNLQHPLHETLQALSPQGREALLNGYRAWLEGDTLWLNGEQGWKQVTYHHWQFIADKMKITLKGDSCTIRYSNLCINERSYSQSSLVILSSVLIIFIVLIVIRSSYLKHRQRKEKRFILQLLTHELRTPITSLGLTVEMFRNDFDNLTESSQGAVWRLMSDYQRLSQLTENSNVYLGGDKSQQLLKQNASVEEWLHHVCDKHDISFELNQDIELVLPYYWLSICIENLIKNAKQHGKGDVLVSVEIADTLIIEVQDQGEFPSPIHLFLSRLKPKHNDKNMKIGLNIVEHLIKKVDGKLTILRHPTRCILEIPYEYHSTD